MTADDQIHPRAARELFIIAHRLVGERYDYLRSRRMNLWNHSSRRGAGIENVDVRSGSRSLQRLLQNDSEQADFHSVKFANDKLRSVAKRPAGLFVDNVCRQPFEMRFAHARAQHS